MSSAATFDVDEADRRMGRAVAEYWMQRGKEIAAGTAKPLPWVYQIMRLEWESQCADGTWVTDHNMSVRQPCKHCRTVHPIEKPWSDADADE